MSQHVHYALKRGTKLFVTGIQARTWVDGGRRRAGPTEHAQGLRHFRRKQAAAIELLGLPGSLRIRTAVQWAPIHRRRPTVKHAPEKYTLMHKHDDSDWSRFWFDQIGWVGYFFAQLEWASFWLAEEVGTPDQKRVVAGKNFVARNVYVRDEVVPRLPATALRDDWLIFFDDINACADMRNDILHNPLEPNMHDIENQGVKLDQGIRLLRENGRRVVEIGDVQHFTNGLRALNAKMISLMQRTSSQA